MLRPALVLPLLFAACASTARAPETPLENLRDVAVRYRAELAPQAGEVPRPGVPGEPAGIDAARADAPADAPTIELTCRLVRFERRLERELFPDVEAPAFGRVVPRAAAQAAEARWRREGRVDLLTAPVLGLRDGGNGSLSVSSQTAFVRGFDLVLAGASMIGDPNVAVAKEGFLLEGRARLAANGTRVALELALCNTELVRPFTERVVHLPGTKTPVALQIPIGFEQELAADAELGADEVLVLGGLVDREGRPYLAFVEGRATKPAAAALPASDAAALAAR
jgi:hypothetical protein